MKFYIKKQIILYSSLFQNVIKLLKYREGLKNLNYLISSLSEKLQ